MCGASGGPSGITKQIAVYCMQVMSFCSISIAQYIHSLTPYLVVMFL